MNCRFADPAPLGAGGDLFFCPSDCDTGLCDLLFSPFRWYQSASLPLAKVVALLRFRFSVDSFLPRPPFQVVWQWFSLTFFLSLADRPPFPPFFLGVPCRLRSLATQRCGSMF